MVFSIQPDPVTGLSQNHALWYVYWAIVMAPSLNDSVPSPLDWD